MQAHKSTSAPGRASALPGAAISDPRELHAHDAARPAVPQARIPRLAGPFRVKPGYLQRREWPFCVEPAGEATPEAARAGG